VSRSDFLNRVCRRLDELVLLRESAAPVAADRGGILVGLSGGPDSVAVLLAVQAWALRSGRPVAAAHLNHLLRDTDAAADLTFCRNLCARLDVPLFEHAADPRPVARARGQGLEEAGRHLRRTFCEGVLADHPAYSWVATGHHRDDQVETVLMRLFRGTGPDGLRGIRPVSGVWLHPLLELGRAEIVAFLESVGQPWRTDASNLDGDNLRARLRRELLPLIRGIFGAGVDDSPARLAALLDDDLALLESLTANWLTACLNSEGDLRVLDLLALEPAAARRVLRAWLDSDNEQDLERVHVENVLTWLTNGASGSTLDLPGGLRLRRDFDRVRRQRGDSRGPVLRFAGDYRILVADESAPGGDVPGTGWSLTCPTAGLHGNLKLRNWRQGDRFQPFGLQGTKKLSDLFREHRVTREDRQSVLVVADDHGILWVVGLAQSERTRLLPSTARTVTISVVKRNGANQRLNSNQTRENT